MTPVAQALVVLRKELKDAFRDRRAIYSIVIGSALGPLMLAFMLDRVAERQRQIDEIRLPVVGIEHAPALVEWLRQQAGVEVVEGPADPEGAVRDRAEDVVVIVPEDFVRKFRASTPAAVRIVLDGSRNETRPKVERVRRLLGRYSAEIGALRLITRGVSPAVASALEVEDIEVSSAQQRAAMLLGFIPLLMMLAAFTGGMQIATDSTAGERERGSLEPLLVNPAPRGAIAAGKWAAAALASMLGVLFTTSLLLAMLRYIPLQELGIRFRLDGWQLAGMLAALLPMSPLWAGMQAYLATFARSFKEAQTYMGFLVMAPMLPGLASTIYPFGSETWMYAIPVLGSHLLAADALGGKAPPSWAFLVAASSAAVVSWLLVRLTTRLLQRERIVFSR